VDHLSSGVEPQAGHYKVRLLENGGVATLHAANTVGLRVLGFLPVGHTRRASRLTATGGLVTVRRVGLGTCSHSGHTAPRRIHGPWVGVA
jgi:hypothetical protein